MKENPDAKEDQRSPLAFFMEQWLESLEGQSCLETSILKSPEMQKYLRSRLESAYLAGAKQFKDND